MSVRLPAGLHQACRKAGSYRAKELSALWELFYKVSARGSQERRYGSAVPWERSEIFPGGLQDPPGKVSGIAAKVRGRLRQRDVLKIFSNILQNFLQDQIKDPFHLRKAVFKQQCFSGISVTQKIREKIRKEDIFHNGRLQGLQEFFRINMEKEDFGICCKNIVVSRIGRDQQQIIFSDDQRSVFNIRENYAPDNGLSIWLVIGEEKAALIDSGMGMYGEELRDVVKGLTDKPVINLLTLPGHFL